MNLYINIQPQTNRFRYSRINSLCTAIHAKYGSDRVFVAGILPKGNGDRELSVTSLNGNAG